MSCFKNGDWVSLVGLDELTKQALKARFVADGFNDFELLEGAWSLEVYGDKLLQSLLPGSKVVELTPEQVLFKEAPLGATKVVRFFNGDFGWLGGCTGTVTFSRHLVSGLAATNTVVLEKSQEQEIGWPNDPSALPPVGEECLAFHYGANKYRKVLVLTHHEGSAIYKSLENPDKGSLFEVAQCTSSGVIKFKPLPEVKYINMSLFKGADIWVEGSPANSYYRDKAENFHPNDLKDAEPIFDKWNTWFGDEKPAWLEGFEFEVIEGYTLNRCPALDNSNFEVRKGGFTWDHVCAIKITGLKDGWKFKELEDE